MKAIAITSLAVVGSAASVPSLENLRNHTLLSKDKFDMGPLESIAHIATFDEIPIFGGVELREQMLQASNAHDDTLASNLISTVGRATKSLGCNALNMANGAFSFVMRKESHSKLGYGSYCEEIPSNNQSLRATLDQAL